MRHKKQIVKILTAILLLFAVTINSYATTSTETDISDDTKKDIEAKRDEAKEILEALEKDKENLEKYVEELDLQLGGIQSAINELKSKQEELSADIKIKQEELEVAKKEENNQYEAMKARIKYVYENGDMNYFDVIFKASSMSDIINSSEYISQLADYDHNMLSELIKIRQDVALAELMLQQSLDDVQLLLEEQEEKELTMETLIDSKSREIATYESSIGLQEEEVKKHDQKLAAIENELARLAALSNSASNANINYTGGALVWPCPSSTRITSHFDPNRVHPILGYARPHNGTDIGVPTGTVVVAAADGVVIAATYNGSAGNYVSIDHGGGMATIYMHNSQLLVSKGEIVSAGQKIALSGSTGMSSGPHLHFGVSVNGSYVNPMGFY